MVRLGLACAVALVGGCGGVVDISGQSDGAAGRTDGSGSGDATGGVAGMADRGDTGGQATGGEVGAGGVEASCSNVIPCGGDVVGTWKVVSSCVTVSGDFDTSTLGLECRSASITGAVTVTGTWTANADGSYADSTTTSGTHTLELPATCKIISGTTTTCNRIAGPFASMGYDSIDCVDNTDTGGCTCTAFVQQAGTMGAPSLQASSMFGSYTIANNVIDPGGHVQYPYCVSGPTMTVTPQDRSTPTVGTVVLQRQ